MNPYELGQNQISKKFKKIFDILLSSNYYEGSKYGKYFSDTDENGYSEIYVRQPECEQQLTDFVNRDEDDMKYLVGYTGVGKTTLLRNYFKVFGRTPVIEDNNIHIYTSFYSMSTDNSSVSNTVMSSIETLIDFISGSSYVERLMSMDKKFFDDFYQFIETNNPNLIRAYPSTKKYRNKLKPDTAHQSIIDYLNENLHLDYSLTLLKYYLYKKNVKPKNIIFIFDDIESKEVKYHEEIMSIARQIKKCLEAFENRTWRVKIIISLRNYSYRMNNYRLLEAFRVLPENCAILKKEVPDLKEVIAKRLKAIIKNINIYDSIGNKETWQQAFNVLNFILGKLYINYSNVIMDITHNNIFASMTLVLRIITNKQFFGKYEIYDENGAFKLDETRYLPINNDDVFRALALGEQKCYYPPAKDYYLANILHSHTEKMEKCELIGIMLIRYFNNIHGATESLYGTHSEQGSIIVNKIVQLFNDEQNSGVLYAEKMRTKLDYMIKFLYENGIFLQSIEDSEPNDIAKTGRLYNSKYYLYLSLRGYQLNKLLEHNSLLFKLYRDDIDTYLENNDKSTINLGEFSSLMYCIDYIEKLFEIEQEYICHVKDENTYNVYFGKEYFVSSLIKGVTQTIESYYRDKSDPEYIVIQTAMNTIIDNINSYTKELETNSSLVFKKIKLIK